MKEQNNGILIELKNVSRTFVSGSEKVNALDGIDLKIKAGEFILILGPSGSGKTTLLNLIGGIDKPTRGHVLVKGHDIANFSDRELTTYRAKTIGWIFQFFNLIPSLNVLENVALGLELAGNFKNMDVLASNFLTNVGLGNKTHRFPSQLSGGEQQRVAIARALVKKPAIIVADEPTGNLDQKTGSKVVSLMKSMNRQEEATFIIVSHDAALSKNADRVIQLTDGEIVRDDLTYNP
ncbi:MAG: ABC transporter ATP-binding protein [Candidatus Hodarchaeales archaeon]|jgi:putative ABC transport system ATP-binding protein